MNTLEHAVRLLATKCLAHYNKKAKKWGGSSMLGEYTALCTGLSYLCACPNDYLGMCTVTVPCVIDSVDHVWVDRDCYNEALDTCTISICVVSKKEGMCSRQHTYCIRISNNAFYVGSRILIRAKRNPFLRALYARLHDKMYWGK